MFLLLHNIVCESGTLIEFGRELYFPSACCQGKSFTRSPNDSPKGMGQKCRIDFSSYGSPIGGTLTLHQHYCAGCLRCLPSGERKSVNLSWFCTYCWQTFGSPRLSELLSLRWDGAAAGRWLSRLDPAPLNSRWLWFRSRRWWGWWADPR